MADPAEEPRTPPADGPEPRPQNDAQPPGAGTGTGPGAGSAPGAGASPDVRAQALEGREKELVDRLARLQADFDNYRRRSRDELAQAAGRGKESFLKALLPVLDNLDRALAHTEDAGLRMIARQLQDTLASQGITVLDPQGEAFDAKLHEAIAQQAKEGAKPGTVLHVAEKGYAMDGRVLRPARVVVAA